MCNNARSIVTTVGPYEQYGYMLVAMAAAYGTHLANITGESDWFRKIIDNYSEQCKATGAILTFFSGHDCLQHDMACKNAADLLKSKYNEEVKSITVYDNIVGSLSGGTLLTMLNSLSDRQKYVAKLGFDPVLADKDGKKSQYDLKNNSATYLGWDDKAKTWYGPFVMSAVMANCVKASNAVLGYGNIKYRELFCYNSIWTALPNFIGTVLLGVGLFVPGIPSLLSRILPPGQGPSAAQQEKFYLYIRVVAKGEKNTVESFAYIPKDPGYYYTSRMLVETGLAPILNADEIPSTFVYNQERKNAGGVWTPAVCLGPIVQKRIERIGIIFATKL
eukprot:UN00502